MGERIRSVQITEVEQLQLIAKRTFFTTFRESYSDEDFKQFFSDAYNIDVLRKELEQSNSFHYFYEVDQNIVGFLKLNINDAQTENKGHAYLEIQRIYFDEAFQGSGRGQLFINLAIDQAIKYGLVFGSIILKRLAFIKTEDLELQGRINFILEV